MLQTLIGVVYDKKTFVPCRVVYPHDDSYLFDGRYVGKNENIVIIHKTSIPATVKNETDLAYYALGCIDCE